MEYGTLLGENRSGLGSLDEEATRERRALSYIGGDTTDLAELIAKPQQDKQVRPALCKESVKHKQANMILTYNW